jgi:hypothetical protein
MKKLYEHIQNIKEHENSIDLSKDMHYLLSILQYINDAIGIIYS